jgi:hypothetical protein
MDQIEDPRELSARSNKPAGSLPAPPTRHHQRLKDFVEELSRGCDTASREAVKEEIRCARSGSTTAARGHDLSFGCKRNGN